MELTPVESPLTELFLHNLWANQQLLRACQELSDEQLDASTVGTYGSIRDTLLHIVGGEEDYLGVLTGEPVAESIYRNPPASVAALRERAAAIGEALVTAATRVGQEQTFPRRYQGRINHLPAPRFLVQILDHAREHRTHVATILTQLGIEPPDLSGWAYILAMGLESEPA
jgi:uncharacterized damage-inducible protein DinB